MSTASELTFLCGEEPLTIIPKRRIETLQLICGNISEMRAAIPAEVPFWLAMYLKKRDLCRIQIPPWMDVDNLENSLVEERRNLDKFANLPYHYLVIAKQLLSAASDDIPDQHQIRALIADIEDHRRSKVQRGLQSLDEHATTIQLNHVSSMELHCIRAIATKAMDQMQILDPSSRGSSATPAAPQPSQTAAAQPAQAQAAATGNQRLANALRRRSQMS